jgi:transposase-like protein
VSIFLARGGRRVYGRAMDHDAIIAAVGRKRVAERFGLSPQALFNWRRRGIPAIRRMAFKRLADEAGVALPDDFLAPLEAPAE